MGPLNSLEEDADLGQFSVQLGLFTCGHSQKTMSIC